LGLQILCERQGRTEEASRYAELAQRCWCRADPRHFAAERAWLRGGELTVKDTKNDEKPASEEKTGAVRR
jgi:hypothetical protein